MIMFCWRWRVESPSAQYDRVREIVRYSQHDCDVARRYHQGPLVANLASYISDDPANILPAATRLPSCKTASMPAHRKIDFLFSFHRMIFRYYDHRYRAQNCERADGREPAAY